MRLCSVRLQADNFVKWLQTVPACFSPDRWLNVFRWAPAIADELSFSFGCPDDYGNVSISRCLENGLWYD